ncbi:serine hydrolase domain-containing protein [Streptomyces sp. NPDC054887]
MHVRLLARSVCDRSPATPARRTRARSWAALLVAALLPLSAAAPALGVPADAQDVRAVRAAGSPERLTPDLVALTQRLRVPGAVVSVSTPEWGTWTTTIGTGDLATARPISTADHMRVGSITKTFTATVILQLVDEDRLSLDDPVAAYRPDVPNGKNITVRHLLQMTSGLYNYSEDLGFNQRLDRKPQARWTPGELLDVAFSHRPYFKPGKGWHYSNTNYVLLGLIAEQLTRQPLGRLLQERVFGPVGMHRTAFANGSSIPGPYARGYQFIGNVASLTAPVLTGKKAAWANWSAGDPLDVTHVDASWAYAAGAAASTVDDLRRWAPALATGALLSPEVQRERLNFVPTSDVPGRPTYGLGIAKIDGFLGHDGQIPGYNSFVGHDPERGATIVVLVNLNQSPDGSAPADELTKFLIAELFPRAGTARG